MLSCRDTRHRRSFNSNKSSADGEMRPVGSGSFDPWTGQDIRNRNDSAGSRALWLYAKFLSHTAQTRYGRRRSTSPIIDLLPDDVALQESNALPAYLFAYVGLLSGPERGGAG